MVGYDHHQGPIERRGHVTATIPCVPSKLTLKIVTLISILSIYRYSAVQTAEVTVISDKPLSDLKCLLHALSSFRSLKPPLGVYKPLPPFSLVLLIIIIMCGV